MKTPKEPSLHKLLARVIITRGDEVLFVRRSKKDSRPGTWEIPGGSVDGGENLEEAARREIHEETGVSLNRLVYVGSSAYETNDGHRLAAVFEAQTDTNDVHLSWEHDEYRWCTKSNYNNLNMEDSNQKLLDAYFSTDKPAKKVAKKTTIFSAVDAFSDGGSRGNPGPSATGYVIYDSQKRIIAEGGEYLGITTNNQAEYQAVRTALEECLILSVNEVNFYVDSLLVVNQMSGAFKIKNRDLWPIHESIKDLVGQFDRVDFTHIPREQNKFADAKVNEVLDSQSLQ